MLIRQALDRLVQDDSTNMFQVAFREKDVKLLREECLQKFKSFFQLYQQKMVLTKKANSLKEELTRISPQALQELERQVQAVNESEQSPPTKAKKPARSGKSGKFIKKSQRKRKPQPKIMYT